MSTSAHQQGANKQLSPNHPPLQLSQSPQQSQDSPNSPYNNGSQHHQQLSPSAALNVSGNNSCGGGQGPILSPNKYRRSISFPNKGSSPTPGYNIDNTSSGDAGGCSGYNYYHQDHHRNGVVGGNSPLEMRPIEHCLNDIIKNMGGGGGGGGGDGLNVGGGRSGPVPIMKNNIGGVGGCGGGMSGVGDHLDEAGKLITFSLFLNFFRDFFLGFGSLLCL